MNKHNLRLKILEFNLEEQSCLAGDACGMAGITIGIVAGYIISMCPGR